MSYTNSRRDTPICGPARPTPLTAYIAWNISSINRRSSRSKSVTGSAGVRSTGSPMTRISRMDIYFRKDWTTVEVLTLASEAHPRGLWKTGRVRVYIGADHAGYELKNHLVSWL